MSNTTINDFILEDLNNNNSIDIDIVIKCCQAAIFNFVIKLMDKKKLTPK